MKPVGKPDAGNPHVRFDERGWETGRRSASAPAPNLDSTGESPFLSNQRPAAWKAVHQSSQFDPQHDAKHSKFVPVSDWKLGSQMSTLCH